MSARMVLSLDANALSTPANLAILRHGCVSAHYQVMRPRRKNLFYWSVFKGFWAFIIPSLKPIHTYHLNPLLIYEPL